ncbi:MAG: S8/S53 family peptidase [Anaerolineae bacterium]|nr:S8/S53 family peptidase [Anaerolineae bacterium]
MLHRTVRFAVGLAMMIGLLSGIGLKDTQAQPQNNVCSADIGSVNGQGRFTLSGLGRFTLSGLEGGNASLGPEDSDVPQELRDEILNNPIDTSWLQPFFAPFANGDVSGSPQKTAILIVDDFADNLLDVDLQLGSLPGDWEAQIAEYYTGPPPPTDQLPILTHGDMVFEVVNDLYETLNDDPNNTALNDLYDNIQIDFVDISTAGSYELGLLLPALTAKINTLQSQGFTAFVINMSFGLLPCTMPAQNGFPAFDFRDFLEARNSANKWVFDVDGRIDQQERVIRPVVYRAYGLLDYFNDVLGFDDDDGLAYLAHLYSYDFENDPTLRDFAQQLQNYLNDSASGQRFYLPIAASGNFADIYSHAPLYPAALPQVIAVGATLGMETAEWRYSQPAHLLTPGAWYNMYRADSFVAGTSFAAPYASMVGAMFIAYRGVCEYPVDGFGNAWPPLVDFNYVETVWKVSNNPLLCSYTGDPIPPTATPTLPPSTATNTPVPPTATNTPVPPTATNTPDPGSAIELLRNRSFEDDLNPVDGLADFWGIRNGTGEARICDGSVSIANTGICAFRFRGSGATEDSILQQRADLSLATLSAGNVLTLRGFVNASGAPNFRIRIIVNYADGQIERAQARFNTNTSNNYIELVDPLTNRPLQLNLTANNVVQVRVVFWSRNSTGVTYWDDISLKITPASPNVLIPLP